MDYKDEDEIEMAYEQLNDSLAKYLKKESRRQKQFEISDLFSDKILIVRTIKTGLPHKLFEKIKNITPFTESDWADYLNLSKKTLQRYQSEKNHIFKSIHTEKIIELAEVTNLGYKVFDSPNQFYLWLHTPLFAIENLKPAELLKDSYGKELVMDELNRIDEGIFV